MNGTVYNYRMEGARYGVSFGTALAIATSYTANQSINRFCGPSSTASSAGSM